MRQVFKTLLVKQQQVTAGLVMLLGSRFQFPP